MLNPQSMWIIFNSIITAFGNEKKFNDLKKTFVYFDLGLQMSLNRYETNSIRNQILNCNLEEIEDSFNSQELPTDKEAENLEIKIIKNSSDYNVEFDRIKKILK